MRSVVDVASDAPVESAWSQASTRRERAFAAAAFGYLFLYVGFVLAGGRERYDLLGTVSYYPLWLGAAVASLVAASRAVERRDRIGWAAIGLGWFCSFVADPLFLIPGAPPYLPVLAGALYLAYYPLVVTGFLAFLRLPEARGARWRLALEVLIMFVGATSLAWFFVWSRAGSERLFSEDLVSALIPIGEIAILLAATASLHRPANDASQRARNLAAYAALAAALGDLMLVMMYGGDRDPSIAALSAMLLGGGAVALILAGILPARTLDRWLQSPLLPLPYAGLVAASAVLLLSMASLLPHAPATAGLTFGLVALVALTIGRLVLAERELRGEVTSRLQQEARFRALIQSSRDALLVVDGEGTIRFANVTCGDLLGVPSASLLGHSVGTLAPEIATSLDAALSAQDLAAGVRWTRSSDSARRALETVAADLSTVPDVGGTLLVTRDVSERVRLERESELSGRLDAVSRLSGSVAHELTNLLTVVRLQTELLAEVPGDRDSILEIDRAARQGADLCRKLLTIGKHAAVARELTDVARTLREQEDSLRSLVQGRAELTVRIDPAVPLVLLDPRQLELALAAVVTNAAEAMPMQGGSIEVSLTIHEPQAESGAEAAPRVVIAVRDTGAGMPAEVTQRAREPFFTTKHGGHPGLGLAIAEGAAAAGGGRLVISSVPGEGTTIALELPATEVQRKSMAPVSGEAAGDARARLLVVDDEAPVRSVIARGLERAGFRVETAADGVDALAVLAREGWGFDALISDVTMPRMDGLELARAVRARFPHYPIILMSGYLWESGDGGTAIEHPRLAKPLRGADLLDALSRLGVHAARGAGAT